MYIIDNSRATVPHHLRRYLQWKGWAASLLLFIFIVSCVKPPPPEEVARSVSSRTSSGSNVQSSTPKPKSSVTAGDVLVKCDLSTPFDEENAESSARGTLNISVHRTLAPLASQAFLDMVSEHHFEHVYLFRAVKGFIVQWGIESPKPDKHKGRFPKVDMDPPPADANGPRRNVRGALNFAGGNSGSGQVYVNRMNNPHLDKEPGSLPFATLDEQSMSVIDAVYSYKEGLGQVKAVKNGDDEVKSLFPRMSRIDKCWILSTS